MIVVVVVVPVVAVPVVVEMLVVDNIVVVLVSYDYYRLRTEVLVQYYWTVLLYYSVDSSFMMMITNDVELETNCWMRTDILIYVYI